LLNRFRRDSQGVTAIEFSIVAMPFLALLIAIFETTLIFFTQSALESGVSEAGRMIRTGQVQSNGISEEDFKTLVCGNLSGYLDCNDKLSVDVRSFSDFASVSVPAATDGDGNMTEDFEFSPGGAGEVVVVRAFYIWDMLTPDHITGMSNMSGGGHLIAAAAAFRNEPF
jgi:Flp pilus assembly protein TadG